MFSKSAIQSAIRQGKLSISPFKEENIEAAHINLHLAGADSSELVIAPKSFVTGSTLEKITFSLDICGFIEGKASLARQGLSVEQSSTFLEPGTDNSLTLEIFNASDTPITLQAGQEIAKLLILKVISTI